ncbi:dTDP-4-dehydrorhamnose reductase [Rossellomorea aquimaris]|uniref:dTDP-4-dehydrorhamnose reductase n=1 Tax=Rossellomorea aquimaris TaxID=189382 RepID=UPI0005CA8034|nr:dTDP-4-dehydrorhamnose reductase [Rossellomorea aquimaris]
MKILVTGYNGQLGYDVVKVGQRQGLEMIGSTSRELDITDRLRVQDFMNEIKPDAIIHCAAYTAVDNAEDDKEKSWDVNVKGTKNLAEAAKSIKSKFMYISTDYVYDGKGTIPYKETDKPNPSGYYGLTKYEGEKVVQSLFENFFIVRISWVFGINGNNFIKTMLRLAETREELNVVADQYGSPTYTLDLSKLLIEMVQSEKYGIYHASNEGFCSWADFATEIFRLAEKRVSVSPITTAQYPTRAIRPKNSRMSKQKLVENGFKSLPSWQDALNRYLEELHNEVK